MTIFRLSILNLLILRQITVRPLQNVSFLAFFTLDSSRFSGTRYTQCVPASPVGSENLIGAAKIVVLARGVHVPRPCGSSIKAVSNSTALRSCLELEQNEIFLKGLNMSDKGHCYHFRTKK